MAKASKVVKAKTAEEIAADEEAKLSAEIDKQTKAPAGVKTAPKEVLGGRGVEVSESKDGVKTITPTGKFEAVGNLIFNEFGQHAGTESNDSEAAKKASSFNTTRKFR